MTIRVFRVDLRRMDTQTQAVCERPHVLERERYEIDDQ